MKRREFLGSVVAGAAAPRLVPKSHVQRPPEKMHSALPRATWLKDGVIQAEGDHEPYIFVVRRGGQRLDSYQHYEKMQSEEVIRTLKDQGVEVFETHPYKGFGMAAEMPEMEETKRAAVLAHQYGLRVSTYIQWNTMMYETFFAEEPRAKNWIQRDVEGRPILLTYGYQQSLRYRPCFANQEYLDYLKKVVRYAVEEVKTDFIDFDNFDLNPEPDSCHCPVCVEGFRNFLRTKYTPEKRRERFGFENVNYVNPPQWNRQNPPEKMAIIFDPAIQEWIDFRCQVMADALRQEAEYAKSLNPEVAIEINPHGITGANRAWENAIDHTRLLKLTDTMVTEEENKPGFFPDGRLVSKIRSYKLARAYHNILEPIPSAGLDIAESLAFNQTVSWVNNYPLEPYVLPYINFYRKYRDLYNGAEDAASVAVFRSYPSITYHNARAQLSAILVEQALIQSRIPFSLIFEDHLEDLSKYSVVILPDSECLSDQQIEQIRTFVENGGGLVATEQAGLYDTWRRLRVKPGLHGLVDSQPSGEAYQERVRNSQAATSLPTRKTFGKGRVVYFPTIEYDGRLPSAEPYFSISNRYWKRPKNWEELAEGVQWAAKDNILVEVSGPEYLVVNLTSQPEKRRLMIHLVNYNVDTVPQIESIDVSCRLPEGVATQQATLYSPDSESPVPLKVSSRSSAFTIPKMETYCVAALSW
jgi:Beta-galactosidase trimerisation domain